MNKKSARREWIESIIIAIVLALFIRTFFVQAFKIPSGSMQPTLLKGDRILVSKFIYGAKVPFTHFRFSAFKKPQRGDIIVFVYPLDPKKDFIKRLIGLPGEKIEIEDGDIYINGKDESNPRFKKFYYYNRGDYGVEGSAVEVPADSFFVLGDNSSSSQDSRYWGFVHKDNLIGQAFFIYWPLNRIRIIR
ncbi:MAG: signal peptidase I [Candidatus Omnitrophota bacterium]